MSIVTPLRTEDREGVLVLLELRNREFGIGKFAPGKVTACLDAALAGSIALFVGVIRGDEVPEATIGLALETWFDEEEPHLAAVWDYVHPDHRTPGHTRKLQRFAQISADSLSVPLLLGSPFRPGSGRKLVQYCRHAKPAGAFFLYETGMRLGSKVEQAKAAELLAQAFGS